MRLRTLLISSVLLIALASPAAATPIVSIQPSPTTVALGSTFSLSIVITGAVDLFAFEFDLGFDPTVLSSNGISEGPFLATAGGTTFFPGTIDNIGGAIVFTAASLAGAVPGATGNGTLATVSFTALGLGTSTISLFNVILLDSTLSGIATTTTQNGAVTVDIAQTVVPEPSTLMLLAIGLVLGARLRVKRTGSSRQGLNACPPVRQRR